MKLHGFQSFGRSGQHASHSGKQVGPALYDSFAAILLQRAVDRRELSVEVGAEAIHSREDDN
jgi:hypothetical protein